MRGRSVDLALQDTGPHTIHNKTSALLLTVGVTFEQKHPNQEYDDNADNSGELAGAHLAGLPRPASARRPVSVIRNTATSIFDPATTRSVFTLASVLIFSKVCTVC
jgi:hypothetical protein